MFFRIWSIFIYTFFQRMFLLSFSLWKNKHFHRHFRQEQSDVFPIQGSKKCYGRARDEPDSWPDTISWANFKGPSFAKLDTCNEIIECLLQSRQIDLNS